MRNFLIIAFLTLYLAGACSAQISGGEPTTTPIPSIPDFATATLVPTFTPRPIPTTAVPTIAPTTQPVAGVLTQQVNVRQGPDKNLPSLGLLSAGETVQVTGKDAEAKWLQIVYPASPNGSGWVSVQFVQVSDKQLGDIPTVSYLAALASPTPPAVSSPTGPAPVSRSARVTRQINVRKGPGQTFDSLGLLEPGTTVTLTGRSQNNTWAQIEYKDGVDGKAWIALAYLEGANLDGLPFYDNQGAQVSAGGTPSAPGIASITPTAFSPAAPDGDSEQNPAARIKFAPDSAKEFIYASDLSAPNGDGTDWVAFTPYEPTNQSTYLYLKLECSGNGGITATLEKDGRPVPGVKPLLCGNYGFAIHVLGGQEYILVLQADGSATDLRYVRYTLYVRTQP